MNPQYIHADPPSEGPRDHNPIGGRSNFKITFKALESEPTSHLCLPPDPRQIHPRLKDLLLPPTGATFPSPDSAPRS